MENEIDYIREFLSNVGVAADVEIGHNNEKIIVIETEAFNQRRAWIEAWFTLIDQNSSHSYFRERLRGSGDTE